MNFILFYGMFVAGGLTGFVGLKYVDGVAEQLKAGTLPPIVVPAEAGIPWLTEQTKKARKEWDKTHPIGEVR